MSNTVESLSLNYNESRYSAVIGSGGIGSGMFFALDGNHTLGREESRRGRLLNRRDYCKLHIVLHYVKSLMGRDFHAVALGMVGDDEKGEELVHEMKEVGIDVSMVDRAEGTQTLFSFCFVYPDGSGGNMTTSDSASARVTPAYIDVARPFFKKYRRRGIVLAVPEVPLDARVRVLEYGTKYSLFRAASFTTGEMDEVNETHILRIVDLFSLNIDEAARIAGISRGSDSAEETVKLAVKVLIDLYPHLVITVTAGKRGNWAWDGHRLRHRDALPVEAVGTAGAGDAFIAGMISGIAVGLCVFEAQELATLISSLSVTSPDTIHRGINRKTISDCADSYAVSISDRVRDILSAPLHNGTYHDM